MLLIKLFNGCREVWIKISASGLCRWIEIEGEPFALRAEVPSTYMVNSDPGQVDHFKLDAL